MSKGNEPAFPQSIMWLNDVEELQDKTEYGLSKRELFAAMAMQGRISLRGSPSLKPTPQSDYLENMAKDSVDAADALIKELEK